MDNGQVEGWSMVKWLSGRWSSCMVEHGELVGGQWLSGRVDNGQVKEMVANGELYTILLIFNFLLFENKILGLDKIKQNVFVSLSFICLLLFFFFSFLEYKIEI